MDLPSDSDHITLLASTTLDQVRGTDYQQLVLVIPRIKAYFNGTGRRGSQATQKKQSF
jgi:hypothetical protein